MIHGQANAVSNASQAPLNMPAYTLSKTALGGDLSQPMAAHSAIQNRNQQPPKINTRFIALASFVNTKSRAAAAFHLRSTMRCGNLPAKRSVAAGSGLTSPARAALKSISRPSAVQFRTRVRGLPPNAIDRCVQRD
jgi:hypothetical protein